MMCTDFSTTNYEDSLVPDLPGKYQRASALYLWKGFRHAITCGLGQDYSHMKT